MKKRQREQEQDYRDPVCGMQISRMSAIEEYEYQGRTYYFCARVCREAFEAEPEKYLRPHRQHGLGPG